MYIHRATPDTERSFRIDRDRSMHDGRYDWDARCDRQHERPLLERTDVVIKPSCPFRKNDDRVAARNATGSRPISLESRLSVFPVDLDHAGCPDPAAEDRHFEQLRLGDELVTRHG